MGKRKPVTAEELAKKIHEFSQDRDLHETWGVLNKESLKKKGGVWDKFCKHFFSNPLSISDYKSRYYWLLKKKNQTIRDILFLTNTGGNSHRGDGPDKENNDFNNHINNNDSAILSRTKRTVLTEISSTERTFNGESSPLINQRNSSANSVKLPDGKFIHTSQDDSCHISTTPKKISSTVKKSRERHNACRKRLLTEINNNDKHCLNRKKFVLHVDDSIEKNTKQQREETPPRVINSHDQSNMNINHATSHRDNGNDCSQASKDKIDNTAMSTKYSVLSETCSNGRDFREEKETKDYNKPHKTAVEKDINENSYKMYDSEDMDKPSSQYNINNNSFLQSETKRTVSTDISPAKKNIINCEFPEIESPSGAQNKSLFHSKISVCDEPTDSLKNKLKMNIDQLTRNEINEENHTNQVKNERRRTMKSAVRKKYPVLVETSSDGEEPHQMNREKNYSKVHSFESNLRSSPVKYSAATEQTFTVPPEHPISDDLSCNMSEVINDERLISGAKHDVSKESLITSGIKINASTGLTHPLSSRSSTTQFQYDNTDHQIKPHLTLSNATHVNNHNIPKNPIIFVKFPENVNSTLDNNNNMTITENIKATSHLPSSQQSSKIRNKRVRAKNLMKEENEETIIIPQNFWKKYWMNDEKLKPSGEFDNWHDDLHEIFEKKFPICSLKFKDHTCNPYPARSHTPYFLCKTKCQHSTCASFTFRVYENISEPFRDTLCMITYGTILHTDERHRRFIRQPRRAVLRKRLKGATPYVVETEMINSRPEGQLEAGNLNNILDKQLLQKISSEVNLEKKIDNDLMVALRKLRDIYLKSWTGKFLQGYIQAIGYNPFYIISFGEDQLKYLLSVKSGERMIYLDATGTFIAQPEWIKKTIYVYRMVLPGSENNCAFCIAEYISSEHTTPALSIFLGRFMYYLRKLSFSHRPIIDKIQTDFSFPLLYAASKEFNEVTLLQYMKDRFAEEMGEKAHMNITIQHICSSHLIKAIATKIQDFFPIKKKELSKKELTKLYSKIKKVVLPAISLLIHSETLENGLEIAENIMTVFGLPKQSEDYSAKLTLLTRTDLTPSTLEESLDGTDCQNIRDLMRYDLADEEDISVRKQSPFYSVFNQVRQKVLDSAQLTDSINSYYSEPLIEYLFEFLLPYYPLWSAIILKRIGLRRSSNACIENSWRHLKNNILQGRGHLLSQIYIQETEPHIKADLVRRSHNLRKSKHKKSDSEREVDPDYFTEETFKKNRYYKANKAVRYSIATQTDNSEQLEAVDHHNGTEKDSSGMAGFGEEKDGEGNAKKTEEQRAENSGDDNRDNENYDHCREAQEMEDSSFTKVEKNDDSHRSFSGNPGFRNIFEDCDYPEGFPNLLKTIYGNRMDHNTWRTLEADAWVNDCVINSFLQVMRDVAAKSAFQILPFDSFFIESLLSKDGLSIGYRTWLSAADIWKKEVWLLPINHRKVHWFLLVVIVKTKVILLIDSMHQELPPRVLNKICAMIESVSNPSEKAKNKKLDWSQWTFYQPRDYPSQDSSSLSGSCGVHLCVWVYVICTGSRIYFEDNHMNRLRKSIARLLVEVSNDKTKAEGIRRTAHIVPLPPIKNSSRTASKMKHVNYPPAGSSSTLEYCSILSSAKNEDATDINDCNGLSSESELEEEEEMRTDDEEEEKNHHNGEDLRHDKMSDAVTICNIFEQHSYPDGFPDLQKELFGVDLLQPAWRSLEENAWIDDAVINALFSLLQEYARESRGFHVLSFPSFLVSSFLTTNIHMNYSGWGETVKLWEYQVWLLPICIGFVHWTLMVVIPAFKIFIYLDSLPDENSKYIPRFLVDNVCSFMECVPNQTERKCKAKKINWKQWRVYKPSDIPRQDTQPTKTSGNCGTHISSWAYILCAGIGFNFTEADMNSARKGIARILVENHTTELQRNRMTNVTNILLQEPCTTLKLNNISLEVIDSPPMGVQTTLAFFMSLLYNLADNS